MKVINLNKFSGKYKIILDDIEYTVKGFTMGDYIDGDVRLEDIDKTSDAREKAVMMVDFVGKITDIPRDVIVRQPPAVIQAIIQVSQGIDPTEETSDAEGKKKQTLP